MLDLNAIPEHRKLARGEYSSVRAAHEDAKKKLAVCCSDALSVVHQINRHAQPLRDDVPVDSVDALFDALDASLVKMKAQALLCQSYAVQRNELKAKAWGATTTDQIED